MLFTGITSKSILNNNASSKKFIMVGKVTPPSNTWKDSEYEAAVTWPPSLVTSSLNSIHHSPSSVDIKLLGITTLKSSSLSSSVIMKGMTATWLCSPIATYGKNAQPA